MTNNRLFLAYIGPMHSDRGGPDSGWRLIPLIRHRAPCEHVETGWALASHLIASIAGRRSPYDWTPDDQIRKFSFCYREIIRDRDDTPAYAVAVEWCIDEVHRDEDCIKHGPSLTACGSPVPMRSDLTAVSTPIVRAP